MTGCRSKGVPGVVRAVALSAAVMAVAPLAAQETPPLDIIPIPSVEVDEIGAVLQRVFGRTAGVRMGQHDDWRLRHLGEHNDVLA